VILVGSQYVDPGIVNPLGNPECEGSFILSWDVPVEN